MEFENPSFQVQATFSTFTTRLVTDTHTDSYICIHIMFFVLLLSPFKGLKSFLIYF